jgi:hypothetical protein
MRGKLGFFSAVWGVGGGVSKCSCEPGLKSFKNIALDLWVSTLKHKFNLTVSDLTASVMDTVPSPPPLQASVS